MFVDVRRSVPDEVSEQNDQEIDISLIEQKVNQIINPIDPSYAPSSITTIANMIAENPKIAIVLVKYNFLNAMEQSFLNVGPEGVLATLEFLTIFFGNYNENNLVEFISLNILNFLNNTLFDETNTIVIQSALSCLRMLLIRDGRFGQFFINNNGFQKLLNFDFSNMFLFNNIIGTISCFFIFDEIQIEDALILQVYYIIINLLNERKSIEELFSIVGCLNLLNRKYVNFFFHNEFQASDKLIYILRLNNEKLVDLGIDTIFLMISSNHTYFNFLHVQSAMEQIILCYYDNDTIIISVLRFYMFIADNSDLNTHISTNVINFANSLLLNESLCYKIRSKAVLFLAILMHMGGKLFIAQIINPNIFNVLCSFLQSDSSTTFYVLNALIKVINLLQKGIELEINILHIKNELDIDVLESLAKDDSEILVRSSARSLLKIFYSIDMIYT